MTRDEQAKVDGVRYKAVNAMYSTSFLKSTTKVQELEEAVACQETEIKNP